MSPQSAHAGFLQGVKTYYDRNTPRFVSSHQSAVAKAIHREVWGQGVQTEKEAFEYVNELVFTEIEKLREKFLAPLRILDLGSGVGGTLFYLARRMPVRALGITLSPVGVRLAEDLARAASLDGVCRFVEGNYLDLPKLESQHAVYAIESFLHGPDAAKFFRSAASVLETDGLLMVCDDFLTEEGEQPRDHKAVRDLADFKRGWHVGSLITTGQAGLHASAAGLRLVEDRDLTPHLKLNRPCDRLIAAFVNLGRGLPFRSPWWDSWVGGHAIQRCLLTGLIRYRLLVFEKMRPGKKPPAQNSCWRSA
ncbi:MAG TPA: class I SAM-dependent methyltransferase [Bryobacteraceae bacterium]